METEEKYQSRFRKQIRLDQEKLRILDSIRYRDEDLAVKAGATLAFSGLIITTSIVQLSTSSDSVIHISKGETLLIISNFIGLFLLFISSLINLLALISTRKYPDSAIDALLKFDDYVAQKSSQIKYAVIFSITGTVLVLGSLSFVLLTCLTDN